MHAVLKTGSACTAEIATGYTRQYCQVPIDPHAADDVDACRKERSCDGGKDTTVATCNVAANPQKSTLVLCCAVLLRSVQAQTKIWSDVVISRHLKSLHMPCKQWQCQLPTEGENVYILQPDKQYVLSCVNATTSKHAGL